MWMSGEVTSIPSLTRSGRPSFSFASSPPSGRTSTAFRVRSAIAHAGYTSGRSGAAQKKESAAETAPHPQAEAARPALRARAARPLGVHVRAADGDRRADPCARPDAGRRRSRRTRTSTRATGTRSSRSCAARRPASIVPSRTSRRWLEACDRRDRGQALLRAPRRRPARASRARSGRTSRTAARSRAARRSRSSS